MRPFLVGIENHIADALAQSDCRKRLITGREALRHVDHVGLDAECVGTEPPAGAAEAADHFVDMEQHVVLATDALDFFPVAFWRDDEATRALHGLCHESCDIAGAELEDFLLKAPRGLQSVFFR